MNRAARPTLDQIEYLAARVFGSARTLTITPVPEGMSTFVYRIERGGETFYLRVLPESGSNFLPEAYAHARLRERSVRVPEIVHCAERDDTLGLSVMVTTEIAGQSVAAAGLTAQTEAVLYAAGQDLARINDLSVSGFGWIVRQGSDVDALAAEWPTNRAFLTEHLPTDLALLWAHHRDALDVAAIEAVIAEHDGWLDTEQAWLAHGDFDLTHIYQSAGDYSGIIDFGEIRGTDRWYDLGHFRLHDGERVAQPLLPWLLAGYRSVGRLPDDAERRIAFASLLIGIRTLARVWPRRPTSPLVGHCLGAIGRDLALLRG